MRQGVGAEAVATWYGAVIGLPMLRSPLCSLACQEHLQVGLTVDCGLLLQHPLPGTTMCGPTLNFWIGTEAGPWN